MSNPMNELVEVAYTIDDFLEDVMALAREKIEEIDHLHPAQIKVVWDDLKHEIDVEKDS